MGKFWSDPIIIQAKCYLTSVIERELVSLTWCGSWLTSSYKVEKQGEVAIASISWSKEP